MKPGMKRTLMWTAIAAVCVIVIAGAYTFYSQYKEAAAPTSSPTGALQTVQLDGQTIRVSIANTEASRELGLGGRTGLAPDEGMLFVFPEDGIYAFWMKDMLFSIDMIWLADDGTVLYMAQNVSPDTYPKDFVPTSPARYVLELPAGYAKAYTVRIGDKATL